MSFSLPLNIISWLLLLPQAVLISPLCLSAKLLGRVHVSICSKPSSVKLPPKSHFYQIALSGSTVISTLLNLVADSQYLSNLIITNVKHTRSFPSVWWRSKQFFSGFQDSALSDFSPTTLAIPRFPFLIALRLLGLLTWESLRLQSLGVIVIWTLLISFSFIAFHSVCMLVIPHCVSGALTSVKSRSL